MPTYGVMVAAAVIVGLIVGTRLAGRHGINPDHAWNLGIVAMLFGIAGCKILLLATDWQYYAAHPREIFSITTLQTGGVWSGGLMLGVSASLWCVRHYRMPLRKTADVAAPAIALAHAIGRVGCFAAGCCWGKPTSLPWGVTFTNSLAGEIVGTPLGVRLHPTQLYEMLVETGNFVFLTWVLRHKRFDGQVAGAYMFLYGFARYFLEFLRDDPDRGSVLGGMMSGTQIIAIFLVIAGGLLWIRRSAKAVAVGS